jgi:hypothetical protein
MPDRPFRVAFAVFTAAVTAVVLTSTGAAAEDSQKLGDDSQVNSTTKRFSEEAPHPGARTVRHWTGHSVNPVDGLTYTYDIVGADPRTGRAATIGVDIIPLNVNVGGKSFNGSDRVEAILASPLFQRGDYTTTSAATTFNATTGRFGKGSGGALSAGNTGVQLLDATMRSQFDKVGTGYHLNLRPEVRRPVAIDVPTADGSTLTSPSPRLITYGIVDALWFQPVVEGLIPRLHLNPTRLAVFVTSDILLYGTHTPANCCVFGAHGAVPTSSRGEDESDGKSRPGVQTFVWSSWMTAGFMNPVTSWTKQDINGLSHEITEWAVDPFATNLVQRWTSPTAPLYGCSNQLETGDPTLNIGFSAGLNIFDQNTWSDGTYHPQDEVFLPWFMRTTPNHFSQPTQGDPTKGRYTFMGDLNPLALFHQPPGTC